MSLQIIHGENILQSRQELGRQIEQLKSKNIDVMHLEAKSLDVPQLESVLGTQQMFATNSAVIIEELQSLPLSTKKKQLIALIAQNLDPEKTVILWEKKKLTAPQLKALGKADVREFKASSALFTWLDSFHLKPDKSIPLFRKAVKSDGGELAFLMLVRQVRLLLTAKTGGKVVGAPFMITKLNSQARNFSEEKLFQLHEKLTFLDYHHKTGQLKLSLEREIEQLML